MTLCLWTPNEASPQPDEAVFDAPLTVSMLEGRAGANSPGLRGAREQSSRSQQVFSQDLKPLCSDETAILSHAQRSTSMDTIDEATYADLARQFTTEQMIEIGFTVRLSNMINRVHAAFSTELDPLIRDAVGDSCPPPYRPRRRTTRHERRPMGAVQPRQGPGGAMSTAPRARP
jgi:hypothetical protein